MRLKSALRMVLAVSLLAVLSVGCASDRKVIDQADQVHGSLEKAVIKDEVLANYLQEVGDRIIEQAAKMSADGKGPSKHFATDNTWMFGEEMRFHFVNSKTLNAFTTGGEHMYIYTELFLNCKSEDELAAVVAHEFAHIYGRHVQKGMDNRLKVLAIAAGGAVAGAAVGGKDNWAEGAAI
ncbi:MAG TPA: M48 family metalloprotease, partial [Tepidisphaeraceae bacterium]|nr:M48 family metalloprotease [Tepidisphaeraceae bacterium]